MEKKPTKHVNKRQKNQIGQSTNEQSRDKGNNEHNTHIHKPRHIHLKLWTTPGINIEAREW